MVPVAAAAVQEVAVAVVEVVGEEVALPSQAAAVVVVETSVGNEKTGGTQHKNKVISSAHSHLHAVVEEAVGGGEIMVVEVAEEAVVVVVVHR